MDLKKAKLSDAILREANLYESDLFRADFESVVTVLPSMIRLAGNWEKAFFGADMLERLNLPPDHNERLRKEFRK